MAVADNQSNKSWELTLYELHRTPQEVISDNTEIAVSPRSLHKELMCPICLDMLKYTMTTKECLHRFCQECIITALRSGNKECPTCRKKLVSKRSLRPDPNFDMLISKIYPNRDEYEAQQERVIAKLSKQHTQALAQTIEEGMRIQALSRQQKLKRQHPDENSVPSTPPTSQNQNSNPPTMPLPTACNSNSNDASDVPSSAKKPKLTPETVKPVSESSKSAAENSKLTSENESTNPGPDQDSLTEEETGENENQDADSESSSSDSEIELVFKPLPQEVDQMDHILSQIRYIKTTSNATVEHLARYIAMRLRFDYNQENPTKDLNFTIYILKAPGNYQPLIGNMTLEQVNGKFWKVNKPLEMYYGFKRQ